MRSERCEPEMFAKMVNTDLIGLFYMTRAAAPHMLRGGGGSIVNLSSIFGNAGAENRTAGYFAAKGGVNQLTRLLACEWGDRNLRVNALAPNFFISEMTRELLEDSRHGGLDAQPHADETDGRVARADRPVPVPGVRRVELRHRRGAERRRRLEREWRLLRRTRSRGTSGTATWAPRSARPPERGGPSHRAS